MGDPLGICPTPGCNVIVTVGQKCQRHAKQRKDRPKRESNAKLGYTYKWEKASRQYLVEHPLCVLCRFGGRITPAACTDHIVPAKSCRELFWESENWCALCWRCHNRKTANEPTTTWTPDRERVVITGLPGTGKTTLAKSLGCDYWDADEQGAFGMENIREQQARWLGKRRSGPIAVIVARPDTASLIAEGVGGWVRHCTTQYVVREWFDSLQPR